MAQVPAVVMWHRLMVTVQTTEGIHRAVQTGNDLILPVVFVQCGPLQHTLYTCRIDAPETPM